MRRHLWPLVLGIILIACKKEKPAEQPPPTPPQAVLLKDMIVDHLPSPYYHFEYDASNRVSFVSFASELRKYDVIYSGEQIAEMRNKILVNEDRLQYVYGASDKVELIAYMDSNGLVYKTLDLFYDGPKLVRIDRAARQGTVGFVQEKTVTMTYYDDGNLKDITHHYLPYNGQPEIQYTIHYDHYDNKVNVDAFNLLHSEFFDHLFLLPGVQLQKNNPGTETLTGDGNNYTVNYTYTYSEKNAPLTRTGDLVFLTGNQTGEHFSLGTTYSYYQ